MTAPASPLSEAMKGAVLVEAGAGWVKVHGVDDAAALAELLTEAISEAQTA